MGNSDLVVKVAVTLLSVVGLIVALCVAERAGTPKSVERMLGL
jgi:hypothetical protein